MDLGPITKTRAIPPVGNYEDHSKLGVETLARKRGLDTGGETKVLRRRLDDNDRAHQELDTGSIPRARPPRNVGCIHSSCVEPCIWRLKALSSRDRYLTEFGVYVVLWWVRSEFFTWMVACALEHLLEYPTRVRVETWVSTSSSLVLAVLVVLGVRTYTRRRHIK